MNEQLKNDKDMKTKFIVIPIEGGIEVQQYYDKKLLGSTTYSIEEAKTLVEAISSTLHDMEA